MRDDPVEGNPALADGRDDALEIFVGLAAQADDSRFEPMIPEGYRRIPVIAAPAEPEVSDVQPPDSIEAASPDPTDEAADTAATGN